MSGCVIEDSEQYVNISYDVVCFLCCLSECVLIVMNRRLLGDLFLGDLWLMLIKMLVLWAINNKSYKDILVLLL